MTFKKIGAFALTGMMAVSAFSGFAMAEETTEEATSVEAVEELVFEVAENNDDAEEITLTVWGPAEDQSSENGAWLKKWCQAFDNEHPEYAITFEYGVCSEGDAGKTVVQDPSASADVYFYANDQINTLIDAGALAQLGGDAEAYVKETNSEAIVKSVTVEDEYGEGIYGIPFTTNTWFMFYDTSVYSEEDIKSLDTMLEKGKVAFPIQNSWYIASFFVANGGTMFGEDGTDEEAGIDFGGDKGVAVTNYLIDLVANENFVVDDGDDIAGIGDTISACFSGSWDYGVISEALGENFGAAKLPSITIDGEEKQLKAFAGSKAIGVNAMSENMKVAVELAMYLGSAEAQADHYELRSIIPCNTELLADEEVQKDAMVVAQNSTFDETSIMQPFVGKMADYWTPAENFGKSIVNGEVTKENAAEMVEEFNTSLNSSVIE
ncbi:MAG: extracellular solute-binding protein [Lachnospiraceae bacterium]|nr:extracellular solute-binding protein [Lachnospiraceae bacterium]